MLVLTLMLMPMFVLIVVDGGAYMTVDVDRYIYVCVDFDVDVFF